MPFQTLWKGYLSYISSRLWPFKMNSVKDMTYWQNELFVKTVAVSMPVSILVMTPSIIVAWKGGSSWIPIMDISTLISITFFILYTRYPIKIKMGFAVSILIFLAVFLIACVGSFGIGSIYLLALSVMISLLFSKQIAYYSIGLNAVIFAAFSSLIYWKFFDWPIVHNYNIDIWITYSLNFLFLNLLVVIMIVYILSCLRATIDNEEDLLRVLKSELETKTKRNLLLTDSEGHYMSLFFKNPSPMWIFDPVSLHFLQVNDATVLKYGYSSEEFKGLTIEKIRAEPLDLILQGLETTTDTGSIFNNVALHCKKNGQQFYVKARCSTIPFQGQQALLVIAHDITTQIAHSTAIEEQNIKLKNIAYMQSHTIRAPLARIKGLWSLLALDRELMSDPDFFIHMEASIEELDAVILGITKDSEPVPSGNREEPSDK